MLQASRIENFSVPIRGDGKIIRYSRLNWRIICDIRGVQKGRGVVDSSCNKILF